jgi:hypothetical protein
VLDLFGEALGAEHIWQVYEATDDVDSKYGKHTVFLSSSFAVMRGNQRMGDRGELPHHWHPVLLYGSLSLLRAAYGIAVVCLLQ